MANKADKPEEERLLGAYRRSADVPEHLMTEDITDVMRLRKLTGRVMDSAPVQIIVLLLVVTDLFIFLEDKYYDWVPEADEYFQVTDYVTIIWLSVEISGRIFAHGFYTFFTQLINWIDLLVSVAAIVFTFWGPQGLPIVSGRIIGIATFGVDRFIQGMRYEVGMNKRRCQIGNFDLDLTYITNRVMAMGLPSEGKEALYRNPIDQVSAFLNRYHPERYRVVNLCTERKYSEDIFKGFVSRYPFEDHNIPPLEMVLQFCMHTKFFFQEDAKNVIAVHCKGGKGRTGLMISAWLVYNNLCPGVQEALFHFAMRRTDQDIPGKAQAVGNPSQIRFLRHFENVVKYHRSFLPNPPRKVTISSVVFDCLPSMFSPAFDEQDALSERQLIWIVVKSHPVYTNVEDDDTGASRSLRKGPNRATRPTGKLMFVPQEAPTEKCWELIDSRSTGYVKRTRYPMAAPRSKATDTVVDLKKDNGASNEVHIEWNACDNNELSGEVCIELHSKMIPERKFGLLCGGINVNEDDEDDEEECEDTLLAFAWLHADFLEYSSNSIDGQYTGAAPEVSFDADEEDSDDGDCLTRSLPRLAPGGNTGGMASVSRRSGSAHVLLRGKRDIDLTSAANSLKMKRLVMGVMFTICG